MNRHSGARVRRSILVASLLAAPLAPLRAQQAPAVAGTWIATRETPASVAVAPSSVFGGRFNLDVQGDRLTMTRLIGNASVVSAHVLDGSESTTRIPGRACMGDAQSIVRASRDSMGIALQLATRVAGSPNAGPPLAYRFRLETPDRLVVETTMRTPAQAAPIRVGTVYRRTSDSMPAPTPEPVPRGVPASIASVHWMVGFWQAPLGASTMEERWTPAAGGAMLALSRTTRDATLSAFEFLCVAERAGTLVYSARPNGSAPTDFVLTAIDSVSATFENPAHDFPKLIRYQRRADGGLDATISAGPGTRGTTFAFRRASSP